MEIINQTELLRCLNEAKNAGSPEDQVKNLIEVRNVPLPWQWEFHAATRLADMPDGPVDIGLGGARGPGKSHAVLAQSVLDDCQRVSNLKGLFIRQTGISAQESFGDLIEKVILGRVSFKQSGGAIKFNNGSRILLGGFKDERDIDKYIGIEYDFIIVEELNQLTEDKYTKLRGSLRTSKPNWRPRTYTSFNPGGIGHNWVKERYIIPFRDEKETTTRFIGSTYKDNPHLNKEYIEYLESIGGDLGRAWREGDWDLFEGQVFHEYRRYIHGIKTFLPDPPSNHNNIVHRLSFDWGYGKKTDKLPESFAAYASVVMDLKADNGDSFSRIITYREWAGYHKSPEEWAKIIYDDTVLEYGYGFEYKDGVCDPAMFNPGQDGSIGIAQRIMNKWKELHKNRNWTHLIPGTRNRIGRVAAVHDWLTVAPDGMPYWMITDNCRYLHKTLPILQYDEHKGKKEDVNCFVKGTKISTINGEKNIEDIRIGDLVYTPVGYRKVIKDGISGRSKTIEVIFSNGDKLRGTLDHKIFIKGRGLVELKDLEMYNIPQDRIIICQNVKSLFTKGLSIVVTWIEGIMSQMEAILKKDTNLFIGKYILIILVKFLMVIIFIIKTMILMTIVQRTWNWSVLQIMLGITFFIERIYKRRLKNGGKVIMVRKFLEKMLKRCVNEHQKGGSRADIVRKLLQQDIKHKNIAMRIVKKTVRKLKNALFVGKEKHGKIPPVHISAVGNLEERTVYNLTVEDAHLYYANGFLVTNTEGPDHGYDSISGLLSVVKFIALKPGAFSVIKESKPKPLPTDERGLPVVNAKTWFSNL